jgi:hypothetical protein
VTNSGTSPAELFLGINDGRTDLDNSGTYTMLLSVKACPCGEGTTTFPPGLRPGADGLYQVAEEIMRYLGQAASL